MIVAQYTITLPADYDMGIIRHRVASRGPSFDTFPGLGLKTFLIREKGRCGAESNQYAPAYLWPRVEPFWEFTAGEGFAGILDSFGWTPVPNWLGFTISPVPRELALRSVTRELETVPPGTDLSALRERERSFPSRPGHLFRAVGLNPQTWSLVRFDYWSHALEDLPAGSYGYDVLHVSAPGLAQLNQEGLR